MWVTQQWLGTPDIHPDIAGVDPARPERRTRDLPWEICLLAVRLSRWQQHERSGQKSAEAVVAHAVGEAREALQGEIRS